MKERLGKALQQKLMYKKQQESMVTATFKAKLTRGLKLKIIKEAAKIEPTTSSGLPIQSNAS